ncbi:MAG: hypothetical protein ACRD9R_21635, partial [Pyrinomonadaceae bacterium]
MRESLVQRIAELMREQAAGFRRLDGAVQQLATSLVNGRPETIESVTRAGESELLRMRSRLVQIMSALASFADARPAGGEANPSDPITHESRTLFESASRELMQAARDFQRQQQRARALAHNGSSFAAACIEMCGVPPTTYRAPYTGRGEGHARWA